MELSNRDKQTFAHMREMAKGIPKGSTHIFMGGRQCGRSHMRDLMNYTLARVRERALETKRHHRCWCGSGKLNKNCCKEWRDTEYRVNYDPTIIFHDEA